MKNSYFPIMCLILLLISCKQPAKQEDKTSIIVQKEEKKKVDLTGMPIVAEAKIVENFNSFWAYYNQYIMLFKKFKAFDTDEKVITRINFLQKLSTGNYFPVALYGANDSLYYKLAALPPKADEYISAYMRQFSKIQLAYCKLEDKPVPAFDFTDVNGKHYTQENTKGKIVLFKCWFINCVACVKEMPALNEIVNKYKNRNDILFISLAEDNKQKLQQFLSATKFDYATVPSQQNYITKKLNVAVYPTHFLINKKGILVQALPDHVQVAEALAKELENDK